jgi:hypothetical protein
LTLQPFDLSVLGLSVRRHEGRASKRAEQQDLPSAFFDQDTSPQ